MQEEKIDKKEIGEEKEEEIVETPEKRTGKRNTENPEIKKEIVETPKIKEEGIVKEKSKEDKSVVEEKSEEEESKEIDEKDKETKKSEDKNDSGEEFKKTEKLENKKDEKEKAYKEKTAKQKETKIKKITASINVSSLPISTKHSIAVCRFIKGKEIGKAIVDLKNVILLKKPVPMKGEIPHRKGIMSGRFPKKTAEHFIKLLKGLLANANVDSLENPIISEAIANFASRPYGKFGRVRKKRTHVKIITTEKREIK